MVLIFHIFWLDLAKKCDILVSEILDTALLGEGVLIAVQDARVFFFIIYYLETSFG